MKYVSIKSILYDLSTTIEPSEWNESTVIEWALKASRKIGVIDMLTPKHELCEVIGHTFKKPDDLKTLTQVWVYTLSVSNPYFNSSIELARLRQQVVDRLQVPKPDIWLDGILNARGGSISQTSKTWRVLYKNTGTPMMPCLQEKSCMMEYREEGNAIKVTPKTAIVLLSYLAYAQDNGEYMIPDNENFKEALTNYILYRLYDAKVKVEPNQFNQAERNMHLQRYNTLAARAKGELNSPDVGTLENLKNIRTRMMPKGNLFESGFQSLNQPERGNRF
jgi:hypothetical protein